MTGRLDGRVGIITGAGDGIGAATARRFVAAGCRVLLTDRSGRAEALVDELGHDAAGYLKIDLSDTSTVPRLAAAAIDRWGRLDTAVANAGVMPTGSIETHTLEDFRLALDVNVLSTFVLAQAASQHLPRGGSIVINASVQALRGHPDRVGYNASKGAQVAMTRSMAVDLAPRNIRVNCVCPGATDTPMLRDYLATVPDPDAVIADLTQSHPLGRIGTSDDVAAAIEFLVSDDAGFITGAVLPVDGGYSMART